MAYWGCGRLGMTLHFQQMTMIKGVVFCKGVRLWPFCTESQNWVSSILQLRYSYSLTRVGK